MRQERGVSQSSFKGHVTAGATKAQSGGGGQAEIIPGRSCGMCLRVVSPKRLQSWASSLAEGFSQEPHLSELLALLHAGQRKLSDRTNGRFW